MKTTNQSLKTYVRPGKTKVSDHSLKCRMCLSRFTEMIDIFLVESEPLTNISIIHFCTGLEVSEDDGLPTRMCTECYRNLMDFFAFKRMCLASDARLKTTRDAAIKEAEVPTDPIAIPEPDIKVEPQDELSLAENSDMVLLETDGFHPDAPDEVFSQIAKFELEEECGARNWPFLSAPVAFLEEEDDAINMEEEANSEEEYVPVAVDHPAAIPLECTALLATPGPNTPGPNTPGPNTPRLNTPTPEKNSLTPTSEGLFVCVTCSKQFRSACSLRRHKLIHVGPQHSCPHCQKQFTQKDSMKRHLLTHMDRRFVCAECSKVLMSREGLKCHFRTHHTDRSQTNNYFKYKCQECHKSFAHASGLSRHTSIHRGIKYECSLCTKKFNDSSQLKRHQRIHLKHSDGLSREVNNTETDADNCSKIDLSKDVLSRSTRLPMSPQAVDYRLDGRETSERECNVLERKDNAYNCNAKDVVPAIIRQKCRTMAESDESMKNKVLKVPYNSKFFGEERRKYVILQAL